LRNPKRIPEILERLRKVWEAQPDMRLGQLIENIFPNTDYDYISAYNIEDEEFMDTIEKHYKSDTIYRRFGKRRKK